MDSGTDSFEQLKELKDLLDNDVITMKDFEEQKKKILDSESQVDKDLNVDVYDKNSIYKINKKKVRKTVLIIGIVFIVFFSIWSWYENYQVPQENEYTKQELIYANYMVDDTSKFLKLVRSFQKKVEVYNLNDWDSAEVHSYEATNNTTLQKEIDKFFSENGSELEKIKQDENRNHDLLEGKKPFFVFLMSIAEKNCRKLAEDLYSEVSTCNDYLFSCKSYINNQQQLKEYFTKLLDLSISTNSHSSSLKMIHEVFG